MSLNHSIERVNDRITHIAFTTPIVGTIGQISEVNDLLRGYYLEGGADLTTRVTFGSLGYDEYDNLDRATEIVQDIDALIRVQKVLAGAFAHRHLDGGPKAAFDHPLYLQAQAQIDALEEALTLLV